MVSYRLNCVQKARNIQFPEVPRLLGATVLCFRLTADSAFCRALRADVSASVQCIERRRIADLAIKHRAVTSDCAGAVSLRAVDRLLISRQGCKARKSRGGRNIIETCKGGIGPAPTGSSRTKCRSLAEGVVPAPQVQFPTLPSSRSSQQGHQTVFSNERHGLVNRYPQSRD